MFNTDTRLVTINTVELLGVFLYFRCPVA